jgi:hypothetical protein
VRAVYIHLAAAGDQSGRPESNRPSGVGAAGFEPANLRDPNAALYQTELRPGVAASMAAATTHGACPRTALEPVETHRGEKVPA